MDNFCLALKEKAVVFTMEPIEMPWSRFAIFKDEDGNEFGLKGKKSLPIIPG